MSFLTDFADQAVVLPLVLAVAVVLTLQRWYRGAFAWLVGVGATFTVVLIMKLIFIGCTAIFSVADIRSPSGHVAAATVVCGGLAAICGCGRRASLVVAMTAALIIGLTRFGLHQHTLPEIAAGAAIGLTGALFLLRGAGSPPPLRLRPLVLTAVFVLALFHGRHLAAEVAIHDVALSGWLPAWCHGTSQP